MNRDDFNNALARSLGDLTVSEFQELLDALGSFGLSRMSAKPEESDLANRVCDLSAPSAVLIWAMHCLTPCSKSTSLFTLQSCI
jgi:hypothetical protein